MRHMSRLFRANFSEQAHFRQLWIARYARSRAARAAKELAPIAGYYGRLVRAQRAGMLAASVPSPERHRTGAMRRDNGLVFTNSGLVFATRKVTPLDAQN